MIVASDGLAFLLVAGLTAVVLVAAAALVLWLMGKAHHLRRAAETVPPEPGPAQLGD